MKWNSEGCFTLRTTWQTKMGSAMASRAFAEDNPGAQLTLGDLHLRVKARDSLGHGEWEDSAGVMSAGGSDFAFCDGPTRFVPIGALPSRFACLQQAHPDSSSAGCLCHQPPREVTPHYGSPAIRVGSIATSFPIELSELSMTFISIQIAVPPLKSLPLEREVAQYGHFQSATSGLSVPH